MPSEYRLRSTAPGSEGYVLNARGTRFDTIEAAFAAADEAHAEGGHVEVYQLVPVTRPEPRDCVLVYEGTGNLYAARCFTATEAAAFIQNVGRELPLMVMRIVPANDAP